ncbi:P-loop containing nucleoside triphosphate hydrolase protein [Mucor mucedo]|uniref:P-loop containing nucleoside triphosphate hydrolase protein n=1 Tax=Mucor mucedo TaxID=29922 RepID=UPI00222045DC|nr:P-loop containing nucleoside triphosphate hydrolase protein [Mucor mucedo]KAI7889763.1 P-loop containing nucleoside triphosphate hydrolase protein [Mucor mucedo]
MNKSKGNGAGGPYMRLSRSIENKILNCLDLYKSEGHKDMSVYAIQEYSLKVDSSLRRMKRRQLEMVIEKVLSDLQAIPAQDPANIESEDEEAAAEYAMVSETPQSWLKEYLPPGSLFNTNISNNKKPAQEDNAMNKSVTSLWNMHKSPAVSGTASPAGSATPLDVATPVEEDVPFIPVTPAPEATTPVAEATKSKKRSKNVKEASSAKRPKTTSESREAPFIPTARLSDLGGIDHCIEEIMELIAMPLAHPEVYLHTGVQPPRGVLLHGPPGCGKTRLAHAIAGELGVPFYNISAPSIVSGMSGESEKKIREVFEEARDNAPCLLFIDEIDAITPKRETAQREMERRIVAQLLTCMDDLSWDKSDNKPVMIIGATNRPDSLDAALRRAGRFDREISMGVPDEKAREKILTVLASKLRLSGDFDFAELAKATPGYVGADLQALITTAGVIAVKRIFKHLQEIAAATQAAEKNLITEVKEIEINESMDVDDEEDTTTKTETEIVTETVSETVITEGDEMETTPVESTVEAVEEVQPIQTTTVEEFEAQTPLEQIRNISEFIKSHKAPLSEAQLQSLAITQEDFVHSLKKVQPSSKREGFATVPDVSWDDIGALQYVRDELRMAVVEPINHPEFFERVGITNPAGVLLWGPPGCGKTLLAKAVANESNTNFISVKGPELLNKYVGESERGVRQVFARARASSPCVIFFDELDALCSRRDDQQSDASARVVNTLLTELDGVENRSQVYVIAATNRPDMIDPAMLRPGRLDKLLYVELPTPGERFDILTKLSSKTPLGSDVDLQEVANDARCEGFSGADLASLVRESAVASLRAKFYSTGVMDLNARSSAEDIFVTKKDFDMAFTKVSPSVLPQDKLSFDKLRKKYG